MPKIGLTSRRLFPYQKLFMNVLEKAPEKPENFLELMKNVLKAPNRENVEALYNAVKNFKKWKVRGFWSNHFLFDSELAWLEGKPWVGDL
ncbi:MAG: hypothetical protein ACTSU4_01930 [Promethearchaeota archaeon]